MVRGPLPSPRPDVPGIDRRRELDCTTRVFLIARAALVSAAAPAIPPPNIHITLPRWTA